jgi:hypothetical protein
MTQLLHRPSPAPTATRHERVPPPAWLSGLGAGLAAALGSLVVCLASAVIAWLAGSSGSMGAALHVGAGGWLLGHGHVLDVGGTSVTLVPLGLSALLVLGLTGCTAWAARTSAVRGAGGVLAVLGSAAVAYGAVVALVTLASGTAAVTVEPGRGVPVTAGVVLLGGTAGALRGSGLSLPTLLHLPRLVVALARGALAGALTLTGCTCLVLAVSLVVHVEVLQQTVRALQPGLPGGLVLVLVCAALLPNVVGMTGAVLLGPGAALGAGTSITLTEVSVGPLPALPWLAAVPGTGTQPVPLAALAVLPVLAGVVAGVAVVRSLPAAGVLAAAGRGLVAGALAGLLVGAGVAASGGAVGPGRMSEVGAPALASLAVAAAVLAGGGLLGGVATRLLGRRGD